VGVIDKMVSKLMVSSLTFGPMYVTQVLRKIAKSILDHAPTRFCSAMVLSFHAGDRLQLFSVTTLVVFTECEYALTDHSFHRYIEILTHHIGL
jgi:hypothetical protein